MNKEVSGFTSYTPEQRANVNILYFENNDKFIIELILKDNTDQLILAKGYDMDNPSKIVETINSVDENNRKKMGSNDLFVAPEIHLNFNRKYDELLFKNLKNKGFEDYMITEMFENIKFDMNEQGAKAENEAVIVLSKSIDLENEIPKKLILDKPFWIIMKLSSSKNPYFILGVNNTSIMKN